MLNIEMKNIIKGGALGACMAACSVAAIADSPKYELDDYRNFFGISWRGNAQDNVDYARQMGYTSLFYMPGMEKCKNVEGLKFYLESPEYATYQRSVDISKKYSPEKIRELETFAALKDASKPFPENIATGWFNPPNGITIIPDFQQQKVIDSTVDKIIERIKKIEKARPGFKFAGAAWTSAGRGRLLDGQARQAYEQRQAGDYKVLDRQRFGVQAS